MINIIVICNSLKSTIDLTWERKRGLTLIVPSEAIIP